MSYIDHTVIILCIHGTDTVQSQAWTNANINTAFTYDQHKRLTDIHANNTPVYGYTLNAKNQRTAATLPDGKTWAYGYDTLGQLTGAQKQDGAALLQNMLYNYDLIGNRTSATEDSTTTNYTSNSVNQYTAVNTDIPIYDADGNMLTNGAWQYTWNAENRMTAAENATIGIRVEADYDYMGRRLYKMVYENNLLTKHAKFVYDGYKLIAEFDALNNNAKLTSYLWQPTGPDVPLMRNEEYLIADDNKNIIELRNASGTVTDSYSYDLFGKATHNGGSDNLFQFSSEYADAETGLVYYNYRYYNPTLGRWINRDPIEEQGGINLYTIAKNNALSSIDVFGLWGDDIHEMMTSMIAKTLNYKDNIADDIGSYNIGVDGKWGVLGATSPMPWGDQSYHFNRTGGRDSRIDNFSKHMSKAKSLCAKRTKWLPFPHATKVESLQNLGISLHPLQDWVAHGDYGIKDFTILTWHNINSPQKDFGDPQHYPDMRSLDAVGSSDGRPARSAMQDAYQKASIKYIGATAILVEEWVKAEFAYYQPGTKRFSKVRQMTTAELNSFKSYLKSSAADKRCRCFFLNDGE